jgi:hypothetical protein
MLVAGVVITSCREGEETEWGSNEVHRMVIRACRGAIRQLRHPGREGRRVLSSCKLQCVCQIIFGYADRDDYTCEKRRETRTISAEVTRLHFV